MADGATTTGVACVECGGALPIGQNPPEPCPQCGSLRKIVSASVTITTGARIKIEGAARSHNDRTTRLRQLREAIGDIEASFHKITDAQDATKRALYAMHELNDARWKRGEWSYDAWDAETRGAWTGLMCVRNAAYHQNASIVSSLSKEGLGPDDYLVWEIDAREIARIPKNHADQVAAYETHVAGKPVLPMLRRFDALIRDAAS